MNDSFENKLCSIKTEVKPSDNAICHLKQLDRKSPKTMVGKRIIRMQIVAVLIIVLMVPTAVFAAHTLSQVLFEKTKDAGITDNEREKILMYLEDTGHTAEQIEGFDPLRTNEDGATYGPEAFGSDLILVEMDNGKTGYVYSEDLLTEGDFVKTPEEAIAWNKKADALMQKQGYIKKIPVYESDGRTVIGEFYIE